jgi:hypothetical protein
MRYGSSGFRQSGERRAGRDLPDLVAQGRIVDPPADLAFELCVGRQAGVLAQALLGIGQIFRRGAGHFGDVGDLDRAAVSEQCLMKLRCEMPWRRITS